MSYNLIFLEDINKFENRYPLFWEIFEDFISENENENNNKIKKEKKLKGLNFLKDLKTNFGGFKYNKPIHNIEFTKKLMNIKPSIIRSDIFFHVSINNNFLELSFIEKDNEQKNNLNEIFLNENEQNNEKSTFNRNYNNNNNKYFNKNNNFQKNKNLKN